MTTNTKYKKIRMGMVGGGQGAFIGAIHRAAASVDGQIELVCGAFSSNAANSLATGEMLNINTSRCYADFNEMLVQEARLPVDERMQFVSIVTPNHLHFPVAMAAIKAGFHVMSDKPATMTLDETLALEKTLSSSHVLYGLTHTYTGYPMVNEARERIASGDLGNITKVVVEYTQGWLASADDEGSKQASWRLDPARAGISCCMGDIGVHAANLAETISGLDIKELCADLSSVVPGRLLDDDGTVLLKFDNGAKGVLISSQISVGEENNLNIRVYGTKASLKWEQQEPNSLAIKFNNQSTQIVRAGVGELKPSTQAMLRTPAGHPEGYIEAFANIYMKFVEQIRSLEQGEHNIQTTAAPGIKEAIRGMAFIENVVAASRSSKKWHPFSLSDINVKNNNNG